VAGDYAYDSPHLLGTMRTGPDLMNIGVRQPSEQWNLGHLFQPRAYVPGSIMPSFPYLFDFKKSTEVGDVEVALPSGYAPPGTKVIATQAALDLVGYLRSLDRSYPALAAPEPAVSDVHR
jgi:cytochrome c oxidase cbb3-type subunit 2